MREARKNKQRLFYALYDKKVPVYETDRQGNIVLVDGEPVETGDVVDGYHDPVEFFGNIHGTSGEAVSPAYGVNTGDYDAVLYKAKGSLPITETSLIWHESAPVVDQAGRVDQKSADYTVKRIPPSKDETVYLLSRVIK